MRKISRRGLLWAGAALIGAYGGFSFLSSRRKSGGIAWPFRNAEQINEDIWSDLLRPSAMAPTFEPSQRTMSRVNGEIGLAKAFDPSKWSLIVENVYESPGPTILTLDDIKGLPRYEITTQLCCIEGWSIIVTWAGARFRDFAQRYLPPSTGQSAPSIDRPEELVPYVYMETPSEGLAPGEEAYYVGLDMQSALHPQTLLCYEMNGQPLTALHGAPLRLVIPVKYGIKNLKRIGKISYTVDKPPDYWARQGYDWFAGL
jgi:DMSO/TMAO reductase YedYZ molybdopterin-dependent catalytic subunit